MKSIDEIYQALEYNVTHITEVVDKAKASGRKVVGALPIYVPIELVEASGAFTVDCWGGEKVSLSRSEEYLPTAMCSLSHANIQYAVDGTYDCLDAIISSIPCDVLRDNNQNIAWVLKGKVPAIVCTYPYRNQQESAIEYTIADLKRIKALLEEVVGHEITDADIDGGIDRCNAVRREILRFSAILSEKPGLLSARKRHTIIKAAGFTDRMEYAALLAELNDLLEAAEAPVFTGKKVYVAGIMCEPNDIIDMIDEYGFAIVGDELAHETRRYRYITPDGEDVYERIARGWQSFDACTFLFRPKTPRAFYISDEAQRLGADAVVYCKFALCGLDAYDYPEIQSVAIDRGFAVATISVDQTTNSFEQARTSLQTLAEQLEM